MELIEWILQDENMDKAKKSYKALLRKIRKQNRQEIK